MFEDAKTYPRPAVTPCHLLRSVLAATRLPHFRAVATGLQPRGIRVAPSPLPGGTRLLHLHGRRRRLRIPLLKRLRPVLLLQESTGRKRPENRRQTPPLLPSEPCKSAQATLLLDPQSAAAVWPPREARRSVRGGGQKAVPRGPPDRAGPQGLDGRAGLSKAERA
jgi:hypothetical protein